MALFGLAKKIFGSSNERRIKPLWRRVEAINALESEIAKLTDAGIIARTEALKARVAAGESLDAVLEDAFATVREAAKRALGQRHYDVQLLGGMVLFKALTIETGDGEPVGGLALRARSDGHLGQPGTAEGALHRPLEGPGARRAGRPAAQQPGGRGPVPRGP